jgi:hypothetical protein
METMRRRIHTVVVGCVLVSVALSSCGDGAVDEQAKDGASGSPARVALASSKLARAQPAATDDDLRATAAATNAFALDLYRSGRRRTPTSSSPRTASRWPRR